MISNTGLLRLRPQVAIFAQAMEQQLRANDHKGGWDYETFDSLLTRAWEELAELTFACLSRIESEDDALRDGMRMIAGAQRELAGISVGQLDSIEHEAADVGNFLMMICDVSGEWWGKGGKKVEGVDADQG